MLRFWVNSLSRETRAQFLYSIRLHVKSHCTSTSSNTRTHPNNKCICVSYRRFISVCLASNGYEISAKIYKIIPEGLHFIPFDDFTQILRAHSVGFIRIIIIIIIIICITRSYKLLTVDLLNCKQNKNQHYTSSIGYTKLMLPTVSDLSWALYCVRLTDGASRVILLEYLSTRASSFGWSDVREVIRHA